ncbi:MAG: ArnT family glycosyltransferase [bacterium]
MNGKRTPWTRLLLLLLAGFLLRAVGLDRVPPALNSDELLKVFDGASVYRTGKDHHGHPWPLFFEQSGEYSPPLYIYFAGLFSTPFGINGYTTRLPSAVLGALSILMTYLFVSVWAGRETGLLAAGLVTISPWNVHYSRIGWEAISLVPLQLAGLWLFVRWTQTMLARDLVFSAVFWGLTLYAYPVARLSTLLMLGGLLLVYAPVLREKLRHFAAAMAVLVLMLVPYLVAVLQNREAMQKRWNFVSILNRDDWLPLFFQQYLGHLSPRFLFLTGNENSLHYMAGGMALGVLLPFFTVGMIDIFRTRGRERRLLLFWLLSFAIPSSLTYDRYDPASMPNALRSINGNPVLEIISALGIMTALGWLSKPWLARFAAAGISAAVGVNAAVIGYDYAVRYPVYSAPEWQYGLKEAVRFAESRKADYDRIVVSHQVRLHPVALACFSGRAPGPFSGADFPKYVLPFYHYTPMYRDFRMMEYERYKPVSRWYTLAPGRNLILAKAGEIEGEPVWRIGYPDGAPAFEVFESRGERK